VAGRWLPLLVIAALLSACGSSSSSSSKSTSSASTSSASTSSASGSTGGTTVTLQLLGGTQNLNDMACGKQEPFEDYPAPAQVRYTGMVTPAPSGRWKVKLKLKLCNGKSFVDASSQKIVGQPSGRFDGLFPITKMGYYSLRAELEGGTPKPQSPKLYLRVG
jgi:hypothetical protein